MTITKRCYQLIFLSYMVYEIKSNIIIDNDTVSSLLFHLPSYLALK
ncbi:not available [Yersinia enterocolitica]|nr:not available [Yersinia enterocolitica]